MMEPMNHRNMMERSKITMMGLKTRLMNQMEHISNLEKKGKTKVNMMEMTMMEHKNEV